jgi:hypothetical protein
MWQHPIPIAPRQYTAPRASTDRVTLYSTKSILWSAFRPPLTSSLKQKPGSSHHEFKSIRIVSISIWTLSISIRLLSISIRLLRTSSLILKLSTQNPESTSRFILVQHALQCRRLDCEKKSEIDLHLYICTMYFSSLKQSQSVILVPEWLLRDVELTRGRDLHTQNTHQYWWKPEMHRIHACIVWPSDTQGAQLLFVHTTSLISSTLLLQRWRRRWS